MLLSMGENCFVLEQYKDNNCKTQSNLSFLHGNWKIISNFKHDNACLIVSVEILRDRTDLKITSLFQSAGHRIAPIPFCLTFLIYK